MAKYYVYPFGVSGDLTPILNPTQPGGFVSYQQGFTINYEGDVDTDPSALPVPRGQINQLMYDVTLNLQQHQQQGFPKFITTSDNGGTPFPYTIYSIVRYDDGSGEKLYMSLVNSNATLPTTSSWISANPFAGTSTVTYTTSGTFLVPTLTNRIYVTAVGGGGGGGGSAGSVFAGSSTPTSAGGGGGGGCGQGALSTPISVTGGSTLTITVGNGGNGGTAGTSTVNGGNGVVGNNTIILLGSTPLLTLPGGGAGRGSVFPTLTNPDTDGGDAGQGGAPGGIANGINSGFGGTGAASILSTTTSGGRADTNAAGLPGSNAGGGGFGYGGGGGGASGASSPTLGAPVAGAAGGAGAPGVVIITF